jgi:hypothetical protein
LDTIECDDDSWIVYEKYWISQMKTWGYPIVNYSEGGDSPPIKKSWSIEGRESLISNRKDKRTINVYYDSNYIGTFIGINTFIRDHIKLDRYNNRSEFNIWSSKISSIISGKRKSHKKYKFELVC